MQNENCLYFKLLTLKNIPMKTQIKSIFFAVFSVLSLGACANTKSDVKTVTPFDAERYLGKWYEIARFDMRFERDLINVTANYSLNENGTIKVVNGGYNTVKKEWKQAKGKAKFVIDNTVAKLKVSFFGPFYGAYNVIALDADYKYAMVVGNDLDYLWILSREKTIPEDIKLQYIKQAKDLGFETDKLIWVKQE